MLITELRASQVTTRKSDDGKVYTNLSCVDMGSKTFIDIALTDEAQVKFKAQLANPDGKMVVVRPLRTPAIYYAGAPLSISGEIIEIK